MKKSGFFKRLVSLMSAFAVMCFAFNFSSVKSNKAAAADLNAYANEIAVLVNETRAEAGIAPLKVVPYLNDMSSVRARECMENFSHNRPNGEKYFTVVDENIVPYVYISENISAGLGNPEETFGEWKSKPNQMKAILNPEITHIGVGVAFDSSSDYGWYWVQIFIQAATPDGTLSGEYIPERHDENDKQEPTDEPQQPVIPYNPQSVQHGGNEDEYKRMANEIAVLVNEARAENGLAPLKVFPYLNDKAYERARECIQKFDHNRPDGTKFSTIIEIQSAPYWSVLENLAAGSSTVEGLMGQWRNSPKHWKAIMNEKITHMGIGVTYEKNSEYGWYAAQLFIEQDDTNGELGGYYPEREQAVTTAPPVTEPVPATAAESQEYKRLELEIASYVNDARIKAGLRPLQMVTLLNDYAGIRAGELSENFSHTRPDGTKFSTVVDQEKFFYFSIKEDAAAGSSDSKGAFSQWVNSPGHWAAIINEDAKYMGIGVTFVPGSEFGWYWNILIADAPPVDSEYIEPVEAIVPKASGDVNGDGVVDSFDYIILMQYLEDDYGYLNDLQLDAADVLDDNMITLADAGILQKYILGVIDNIPQKVF